MLPLSGHRLPSDPVLLGPGGEVTAAAFFVQARALAEALPAARYVINLCETRHGFMLGFAAALLRGQPSLLPPGQGRGDWEQLLQQFPDSYLLGEESLGAKRAFDLSRFLARPATRAFQVPQIDSEQVAAILFTSGSTGQPTAHPKTWGQLWRGAANLAQALHWSETSSCAVVGSVPSQHMFGLESTVMLPWYSGVPVHARKPLLAADLESALKQCGRPSWWMTTPLHLRAALRSPVAPAGLEGVVASTMSLPAALARAGEAAWKVPVMEIYGSTETGALAIRRTAHEDAWVPLPGVLLRRQEEGDRQRTWAAAPHVGTAVLLGDTLDLQPDGRFFLIGRLTDLIKVGGKRTSLSALNHSLADIPGVEDGAYYFPEEARRPTAFYVSQALSPKEVLSALRLRIDPAFLPRPLHRVAQLPRNANGKLSQAALASLFAQCRAEGRAMMVPADHPALSGHFPNDPVVPGVVILARVADALRAQVPQLELGALLNARFHAPLKPGQGFAVHPRLEGGRVRFEVRLAPSSQAKPGAVIASGRWARR